MLLQGPEEGYVCEECFGKINVTFNETDKRPQTPSTTPRQHKRTKVISSPLRRSSTRRLPRRRLFSVVALVSALQRYQYIKAFRMILTRGPAAERAFDKVVSDRVRQQFTQFLRNHRQSTEMFNCCKSVYDFSWGKNVARLATSLPTLMSAATASMPKKFVKDNNQLM